MTNPATKTTGYHSIGTTPAALRTAPIGGNWFACLTLVRLVEVLQDWRDRSRQRHHLATLDHHMLRDIGLSSADVEHEIDKPFWRS